ncbi:MAG: zinc ABC transporter substrate-binding protein [Bacteroidales bacterium]
MKPILAAGLLAVLLLSCRNTPPSPGSGAEKPVVSVSILPQQYFLEQLAGDLVEINVLVPPGAGPETYEPTMNQMAALEQSALYFRIGQLGFENAWMPRISGMYPGLPVVDCSAGIDLIREEEPGGMDAGHGTHDETDGHEAHVGEHDHGGWDPHIWMSVRNGRRMATTMAVALEEILPEHKELLHSRLDSLLSGLDDLDRKIDGMLAGKTQKAFMIYHPALAYFAKDYGLEQHALESGGNTPSPGQMKAMVDLGLEKGIHTVFIQKQFDRENALSLASAIGAEVEQIDPLDPAWSEQMIAIAGLLKEEK